MVAVTGGFPCPRAEWARVDPEEDLSLVDFVALPESDVLQDATDLRVDPHRLHRLDGAIGPQRVRRRPALDGGEGDGDLGPGILLFLGAGTEGGRAEEEDRNALKRHGNGHAGCAKGDGGGWRSLPPHL